MNNSEDMFFFIADISGYTAFMLKNETDFEHGTLIIMQLMESMVKEVKGPFEISKLEGDALFLFLRKSRLTKEYEQNPLMIGQKLMGFFDIFYQKAQELQDVTDCKCAGCSNIRELKLKIVGHYGKAALTRIGSFLELSGVDVIIPHRLLKNQVHEKTYLLLTENAYHHMTLPPEGKIAQMEEYDKDLGKIPIFVYFPQVKEISSEERKVSIFEKRKMHLKMKLQDALLKLGLKRRFLFRNLPVEKK